MYFIRQGDQIRFIKGLYQGSREAASRVPPFAGGGILSEKSGKSANNLGKEGCLASQFLDEKQPLALPGWDRSGIIAWPEVGAFLTTPT
jgi:hypothetical protein